MRPHNTTRGPNAEPRREAPALLQASGARWRPAPKRGRAGRRETGLRPELPDVGPAPRRSSTPPLNRRGRPSLADFSRAGRRSGRCGFNFGRAWLRCCQDPNSADSVAILADTTAGRGRIRWLGQCLPDFDQAWSAADQNWAALGPRRPEMTKVWSRARPKSEGG